MDISIVIGANYGDEGKGVITDALAARRPDSIIVLTNGGSQRGHTVVSKELGARHVFHHFGSGTFRGCSTYFPETFILNPMQFAKEYAEINACGINNIFSARHPNCMFSTPFDMILNQDIERWRVKHGIGCGTCGMGIWETICRYGTHLYSFWDSIDDFNSAPLSSKVSFLWSIAREYCRARYSQITCEEWKIPEYVNDDFIRHYIDDVAFMCDVCRRDDSDYQILKDSERNIIFENGQGLMLDEEYAGKDLSGYSTPSHTGLRPVRAIIEKAGLVCEKLDAYYVTRPYLTRHGPGPVQNTLNGGRMTFSDKTNKKNEMQGEFTRYSIDPEAQRNTINKDLKAYMRPLKANGKRAFITYTHLDEDRPTRVLFPDSAGCGTEDGSSVEGLNW